MINRNKIYNKNILIAVDESENARRAVSYVSQLLKGVKGYKVLTGIRGEKPKDTGAIKNILARLSDIAVDNPAIKEIDLNPVIVHDKGASIVDSRMILAES